MSYYRSCLLVLQCNRHMPRMHLTCTRCGSSSSTRGRDAPLRRAPGSASRGAAAVGRASPPGTGASRRGARGEMRSGRSRHGRVHYAENSRGWVPESSSLPRPPSWGNPPREGELAPSQNSGRFRAFLLGLGAAEMSYRKQFVTGHFSCIHVRRLSSRTV